MDGKIRPDSIRANASGRAPAQMVAQWNRARDRRRAVVDGASEHLANLAVGFAEPEFLRRFVPRGSGLALWRGRDVLWVDKSAASLP